MIKGNYLIGIGNLWQESYNICSSSFAASEIFSGSVELTNPILRTLSRLWCPTNEIGHRVYEDGAIAKLRFCSPK